MGPMPLGPPGGTREASALRPGPRPYTGRGMPLAADLGGPPMTSSPKPGDGSRWDPYAWGPLTKQGRSRPSPSGLRHYSNRYSNAHGQVRTRATEDGCRPLPLFNELAVCGR